MVKNLRIVALKKASFLRYEQVIGWYPFHVRFLLSLQVNLRKLVFFGTKKLYAILVDYGTFDYTDISILGAFVGRLSNDMHFIFGFIRFC